MCAKIKKMEKETVEHKEPSTRRDLQKLYMFFNSETVERLQDKFFCGLHVVFCNKRHENFRDLRISDYSTGTDDEGRRFIYMFLNHTTQNHKYDDIPGQCGRMKEQQLYPYNSIVRFRHWVSLRSLADIMHMVCRPRSHVIYV